MLKLVDKLSIKNEGVIKAFEQATGYPVKVDSNNHLIGALGVALLAKKSLTEKPFTFDIANIEFKTRRGCIN